MSKLHVHYPELESHTDLSEADIDILRKVEPEVLKALPTLFGLMTDATWIYLPDHAEKYFRLVAHTHPQKTIGEFGLKFLNAQTREAFYGKLESQHRSS